MFEGENFHEFHGFVAIRKRFFVKCGGVALFGVAKQAIHKSFLRENRIFTNLRKRSPSKVSYYMVFSSN